MLSYLILSAVIITFLGYFIIYHRGKLCSLLKAIKLAFIEFAIGFLVFTFLLVVYNNFIMYDNDKSYIVIITIIILNSFILYILNIRCIFKKFNVTDSIIILTEYIIQAVLLILAVMQATYQYIKGTGEIIKTINYEVINLAILPTLISIIVAIVLYKLVENKL